MIRYIDLHNFKCFEDETFRMGKLTLMTGVNGVGKSSLIQALLLLRQSYVCGNISLRQTLRFNGELLELIDPKEVRYANCKDNNIGITIKADTDSSLSFLVDASTSNANEVPLVNVIDMEAWKEEGLFNDDFVSLYADRAIPQSYYARKVSAMPTDSRLGDKHGCNAVFRLQQAMNNNEKVHDERFAKSSSYVNSCVSYWLSYILGTEMSVSVNKIAENQVQMQYVLNEAGMQIAVSPLNMAFGPTYIFPIVLGILTAPKGSMFIVENPEAHLHPSAQTRMGEFLSIAASCGVQVVVESHSDHLMNGIRLAVKHEKIAADEVVFYAVNREGENNERRKQQIDILPSGAMQEWPNGFFDEWEKCLIELI